MNMSNHALSRLQKRIAALAPSKKYDQFNFMHDMKTGSILRAQRTREDRWKMEVSLCLCSWHQNPRRVNVVLILCPDMKTVITLWISLVI